MSLDSSTRSHFVHKFHILFEDPPPTVLFPSLQCSCKPFLPSMVTTLHPEDTQQSEINEQSLLPGLPSYRTLERFCDLCPCQYIFSKGRTESITKWFIHSYLMILWTYCLLLFSGGGADQKLHALRLYQFPTSTTKRQKGQKKVFMILRLNSERKDEQSRLWMMAWGSVPRSAALGAWGSVPRSSALGAWGSVPRSAALGFSESSAVFGFDTSHDLCLIYTW